MAGAAVRTAWLAVSAALTTVLGGEFTTPQPYRWAPPRPMPSQVTCLEPKAGGCKPISDRSACLSSRDANTEVIKDEHGLSHFGEPCVWCRGQRCVQGSESICEPYDYVVHGKEKGAFEDYDVGANLEVATCASEGNNILPVAESDAACLSWSKLGCFKLVDEQDCVSSRDGTDRAEMDGLPIAGQPCVWCGGACTDRNGAACAPRDWLFHGEGVAFSTNFAKLHYKLATCKDGKPVISRPWLEPTVPPKSVVPAPMSKAWWRPPHPTLQASECLRVLPTGCDLVRDEKVCLTSRDGRRGSTFHTKLGLYGEPCVWCGGGNCESTNQNKCGAFNYLMYGEGADVTQPSEFLAFHAKDVFKVATCKDGEPIPSHELPWGGEAAFFVAPSEPSPSMLTCLARYTGACSSITDMHTCMNSRDGSGIAVDPHGLKHDGQACVWCDGAVCTDNSTALCQPFDYLMHGEKKAFFWFSAKSSFATATCALPQPRTRLVQQVEELTCLFSVAAGCGTLSDRESCVASRDGSSTKFLDGLRVSGQACVWCAGAACTDARASLCEPFDVVVNGIGRYFLIAASRPSWETGICKGGRPAVAAVPDVVHADADVVRSKWDVAAPRRVPPYAQCGGEEWAGNTVCVPGHWCSKQTESFSQCTPSVDDPLADLANLRPDGRFITDRERIYWQDPYEGKKHQVTNAAMCDYCGCTQNMVEMASASVASLPEGIDFGCHMLVYSRDKGKIFPETGEQETGGGRFITDGTRVYWEGSDGASKHLVNPSSSCDICGCKGETTLVSSDVLDGLVDASSFTCGMVRGPVMAVLGTAAGSAVARHQPASPAASSTGRVLDGGRPGWLIPACLATALLVGAAAGTAGYGLGFCGNRTKSRKKSRATAVAAGDEESTTDEDDHHVPFMSAQEQDLDASRGDTVDLEPAPATPSQRMVPLAPASTVPMASQAVAASPQQFSAPPSAHGRLTVLTSTPAATIHSPQYSPLPLSAHEQPYRTLTFTGANAQAKANVFLTVPPSSGLPLAAGSAAMMAAPTVRAPQEPVATVGSVLPVVPH